MTAEVLFSDFGILLGLLVHSEVSFTGANRPNCRQWSVLRHGDTAGCLTPAAPSLAKALIISAWHAIRVNSTPDASEGNTLNQKLEVCARVSFNRYKTRAASYGRRIVWCLVPV
jgi:hypothetical protein